MSDIWVSDASPVVLFAKVGHLHLLSDIPGELLLPDPVVAELLAGAADDPARRAVEGGWSRRVVVSAAALASVGPGLGRGEAAVVAVGLTHPGSILVLDDWRGRQRARSLGLPIIGTLGVILRARREGRIGSAADLLRQLRTAGLYLDDQVAAAALAGVGETWP